MDVLLNLILTNKEGLVEDARVGGSLGCSDHEMVEFRILQGGSRAMSWVTALDFKRANFGLFKDLLGGIPWTRALEGRGSKRAGQYSRTTSSKLRIGASPGGRSQAEEPGDPHG